MKAIGIKVLWLQVITTTTGTTEIRIRDIRGRHMVEELSGAALQIWINCTISAI